MTAVSSKRDISLGREALAVVALGSFVGSIVLSTALQVLALVLLVAYPTQVWVWAYIAFLATITFIPLTRHVPFWARSYIASCCTLSEDYFPTTVIVEEEGSIKADVPYVIGLEPHSVLPVAIPAVFGLQSTMLPEALRGRVHGLASTVCFSFPVVRHMYWWLGLRPITKTWIRRLLAKGKSVVLVPGGVQELFLMKPGLELAYLRKRKGFIRVAMQNHSPVIPVYVFGQNGTYNWWAPGPPLLSEAQVAAISRKIGMMPLVLLGRWGTTTPRPSPLTVVLGKPIEVPHSDAPAEEVVQEYLDQYIEGMKRIFNKYKAGAGLPDKELMIL